MWMLDVFCCALGCVILLLLLKMREASIVAEESAEVSTELSATQETLLESQNKSRLLETDLAEREGQLVRLRLELDESARNLALIRRERDELAKNLALAENAVKLTEADLALVRKKIDETEKNLALTRERSTKSEVEVAKKTADIAILAKKLVDAAKSEEDLQRLLREKEKLRTDASRQILDLSDRLIAAESKVKSSTKQIDILEKQIADTNVTIVDLQGTKAKLADKINKLEIESDQRFAGIAMTGKNVVFLVDVSGSMDRIDENTIDPTKWPTVIETLLKVIRSLPDLSQYQVILFSSKYSYMLGNEGQWLKYEREKSIEQIRKAMMATKPIGDTNLYAAFEETFKFRAKGLDTIYLVSDGLPTSGLGLTATEDKTITSEAERGAILARYLRKMLRTVWNAPGVNKTRVRINAVGFFYESPDVGAFLWALARENDGSFVGMSRP